ncbi:MAG: tetratricopeptide repeat protein [Bacteroidales bacterium]|nr:tetratricopeptide repeat protein [Bacteroidales bacterium]
MKYILTLCLPAVLMLNVSGQSQYVDSLVNVLETQKPAPAEQLVLILEIFNTCVLYDLDKACEYAKMGLALAEKENHNAAASIFNMSIGRVYATRSNFDTALVLYSKALVLAVKAGDKVQEASVYMAMGIVDGHRDNDPSALEYFRKALSIYESEGNKQSCVLAMGNIACTYRVLENDEMAVSYLERAKVIAEEIDDASGKITVYYDLGAIYHRRAYAGNRQENAKLALEYELKAYEISRSIGDKTHQAAAAHALHEIYSTCLDDEDTAFKYAEEGLRIAREFGDPSLIVAALKSVSSSYYTQKRYKESEAAALEAWKMDSTNINMGTDLLRNIILSYAAMCDNAKAVTFFDRYEALVSRHIDRNNREIMADMEVRYETEKKEKRITTLLKERQLYIWLGVTGAMLACSLGIALWLKARNTKKEKLLVASKAVQDGEMGERERIASELHDRLLGTLSAVKSGLDHTAVGDQLNSCIEEVRRISRNLMPLPLRFGIKTALEDFTAQFPNVHFHFFGRENRIEKRLEFAVYCCVNELVTNSIRHSGAKSINVQLVQGEDHVALTVQDDGCGFDEKAVIKGVGLKSIRDRVASCNGKMEIFSSPDRGTETIIEITV